ncbi:MAG: hypothetical protein Q7S02_06110 [bacterium]|nr:hypothetical protein [bacterium]
MVAVETPQESFRKLITHPLLQGCVLVALAISIAIWIQEPGRFPDPDSFYHAGMAELAAGGQFPHRFPWLDLTSLRGTYADLHLVYHIVLVPFVEFFGPTSGIRIATITAIGLLAIACFMLLRALVVRGAFACTLLMLGSAAFMFRMNLAKAQGFAFVALFLGLIALTRRSRTGVFLAALFATWTSSHWPVFAVAVATFAFLHVFTTVIGAPTAWRTALVALRESFGVAASATLGIASGLIVNPYFPDILTVAKQQIIDIALIGGIPEANVGIEWGPLSMGELFRAVGFLMPLVILAIIGTIVLIRQLVRRAEVDDRDAATRALTFGLLTLAFTALTVRSQRHIEFLVPFAILFIAVGWQPIIRWLWPPRMQVGWRRPGAARRSISTFMLILAIIGFTIGSGRALAAQRQYFVNGIPSDHLAAEAAWVREHIPAGAIVFHADWDDFPPLFLNDRTHRYLIGLDPRFAFFDDAERFRRWAAISRGEVARPSSAIVNEFGALVAVIAHQQEGLQRALAEDPHATTVFKGRDANVYTLTQ